MESVFHSLCVADEHGTQYNTTQHNMKTNAELTQKKVKGTWSCNSRTMVKSFRSAKTKWGVNLSVVGQQDIFLAFNRKSDAIESIPFLQSGMVNMLILRHFFLGLATTLMDTRGWRKRLRICFCHHKSNQHNTT